MVDAFARAIKRHRPDCFATVDLGTLFESSRHRGRDWVLRLRLINLVRSRVKDKRAPTCLDSMGYAQTGFHFSLARIASSRVGWRNKTTLRCSWNGFRRRIIACRTIREMRNGSKWSHIIENRVLKSWVFEPELLYQIYYHWLRRGKFDFCHSQSNINRLKQNKISLKNCSPLLWEEFITREMRNFIGL